MADWLMKSEPAVFGLDDLRARPGGIEPWDGVRNYQARNLLRDQMQVGDRVLFYHSNCRPPGIAGIAEIASPARPDPSAFDPHSDYFDSRSSPNDPRWFLVDVRYVRHLRRLIPLAELREHADGALAGLALLRRGNRLSVMPVAPAHWAFILSLE